MVPETLAESRIHDSVAAKVFDGVLPHADPVETWGGKGTGRPCDGCEQRIVATDLQITAHFGGELVLRFHPVCFVGWFQATEEARDGREA